MVVSNCQWWLADLAVGVGNDTSHVHGGCGGQNHQGVGWQGAAQGGATCLVLRRCDSRRHLARLYQLHTFKGA